MRCDRRGSDGRRDVIVVLGAAVWRGGQPSPALRRRLLQGVALMKEGKADRLLLAGGLGKYRPTEARLMRQLAIEEGIPESRIVLEDEGTTTLDSITRCARIMRSNHWNSAMVVSDSYHLFRSTLLFRLLGMKAIGCEAKGGKEANSTLKWWYYYLREVIALPWTLIVALLKRE